MKTKENQNLQEIIKEGIKNMKKQGISLVMLVITIIVMTIIAGVVIMTLSDSAVMDKANQVVNETNLKQVQQLASLAWAEAYLEDSDKTDAEYYNYVSNKLSKNNINIQDYDITVDKNGVHVGKTEELIPSITLDKKVINIDILAGKTSELQEVLGAVLKNAPEGTQINWSSSNESVVGVSEYTGQTVTLTAYSAGTATITASITVNGIRYFEKCIVNVSDITPAIILDKTNLSMNIYEGDIEEIVIGYSIINAPKGIEVVWDQVGPSVCKDSDNRIYTCGERKQYDNSNN